MCHYRHLTLIEREKVMFFRSQGKNLSAIVKELGCSKTTISRELPSRRSSLEMVTLEYLAYPPKLDLEDLTLGVL